MAAVSLGASSPVHQPASASGGTPPKVVSLCGAGALSGAPSALSGGAASSERRRSRFASPAASAQPWAWVA